MTDARTFGSRLREAYERRGMTQAELAEAAGAKQGQVSEWVSGREPKLGSIQKLVAALGVSGHWLLTGEGSMDDLPGEAEHTIELVRMALDPANRRAVLEAARVLRLGGEVLEAVEQLEQESREGEGAA